MSYSSAPSIPYPYSNNTTVSSSSSRLSSGSRGRIGCRWFPVSCNKCQKAIDSNVFICSCKCLFCEGKEDKLQSHDQPPNCVNILLSPTNICLSDSDGNARSNSSLDSFDFIFASCSSLFAYITGHLNSSSMPYDDFSLYFSIISRLHLQSFSIKFELPRMWTTSR